MLEKLDSIDWAELTHAYGDAQDVPEMIRALASRDRERREWAYHSAYGNIFHQGTRYSATPPAIGCLIELAAEPTTPDRSRLLALVVHCVGSYLSPTWGPATASGAIWGETVAPMAGYGETKELLADCERAAEPAVPLALELLSHPDPALRESAAFLLACVQAHATRHGVAPRLREHLGREEDPQVRAMIAFALTHVVPASERDLATIYEGDSEPLVRLLAAMGSVRRGEASPEMARALVGWLDDEELDEQYRSLPFGAEDLAGDIGALLGRLGRKVLDDALPTLLDRLSGSHDFGAVGLLSAGLAAVFGDGVHVQGSELTEPQRRLAETLVGNQAFWSLGNALELLRARGLPEMRDEMARLLGVTVDNDPLEAAKIGARFQIHFGEGRALQEWLKLLETYPDDREALAQAGTLALNAGMTDRALPLLERAIAAGPPTGEHYGIALFARGNLLFDGRELEGALEAFTAAQPHLPRRYAGLARQNRIAVLQRLGRPGEALAIENDRTPRTASDYYHRGLAEVKAGRYRECIASLAIALAREPDDANAHYTVACAHALLGEHDAALASIGRAIEIEPELTPDIAEDEDFAALRGDPRFAALVGR